VTLHVCTCWLCNACGWRHSYVCSGRTHYTCPTPPPQAPPLHPASRYLQAHPLGRGHFMVCTPGWLVRYGMVSILCLHA